jgi:RecA-family ATPase
MINMNGQAQPSEGWQAFVRERYERDPLPIIEPRDWQDQPVPALEWAVRDMIPKKVVALLAGDGGTGKTLLAVQLCVSSCLGLPWLGKQVEKGGALLYTAEDDEQELHRRFAATVAVTGHQLEELDCIHIVPMVGLDPVLATARGNEDIGTTAQFEKLKLAIEKYKPKLVIIDPAADVYAANENVRSQVRQFVQKLNSLTVLYGCTVILCSHPSVQGMASGSGYSGSTAWNGSVRARLYLKAVRDDPDARVVEVMKTNRGRVGEKIDLRWRDGVFVVDGGSDEATVNMANRAADDVFMKVFWKMTAVGIRFSPKRILARMHRRKLRSTRTLKATAKRGWRRPCSVCLKPEL